MRFDDGAVVRVSSGAHPFRFEEQDTGEPVSDRLVLYIMGYGEEFLFAELDNAHSEVNVHASI